MEPKELKVISVKCRFRCLPFSFNLKKWESPNADAVVKKRGSNFISIRTPKYVFVVFSSGDVNLVKVKSEKEAQEGKAYFLSLFGKQAVERERWVGCIAVDNIALTTKLASGPIPDFSNFLKVLGEQLRINEICFNLRRFSGCTIKTGFGSAIIFSSGSINFLGVKTFAHIPLVKRWLADVENIRARNGF